MTLSKTNFPLDDVTNRGVLNKAYQAYAPLGNVLYVDSVNGSSAGPGWTPAQAYATVAQALAAATANNGDEIHLMPGHNEGIGNAQLTWNKAGVKIVGFGEGPARPRFDFDHANASIDITASGMTVQGIDLLPSVTVVAIGVDVNAAATDTTFRDVKVLQGEDGAGVDEFVLSFDLKAGCNNTKFENCRFDQHALATGQVAHVSLTGASDNVVVRDCWMRVAGAAAAACINGLTTLSTNVLIEDCVLIADNEPGIELLTGTTGVIRDVDIFTDLATIDAAIVADACAMFECRYVEVGGEASAATYIGVPSVDD
jgi:hypothetical protein